jgi:hypothetical protein
MGAWTEVHFLVKRPHMAETLFLIRAGAWMPALVQLSMRIILPDSALTPFLRIARRRLLVRFHGVVLLPDH